MKISGLLAGCAAVAIGLATPALAQQNTPSDPFYFAFGAGGGIFLPFLGNLQTDGNETPSTWSMPGGSLTGNVAIGLVLPHDVRTELAAIWTGGQGGLGVSAEGTGTTGVTAQTFTLMASIWRDFAVGNNITFHAGGGIGLGIVQATFSNASPNPLSAPIGSIMVGAGASYALGNGMTLTLDWRTTASSALGGPGTVSIDTGDETISGVLGMFSSTVSAGLRIPFGAN